VSEKFVLPDYMSFCRLVTKINQCYTISRYKLSFWAAASAQRALAAAVRARPPAGRARPSPLHIKKALASKWYYYEEKIVFLLVPF